MTPQESAKKELAKKLNSGSAEPTETKDQEEKCSFEDTQPPLPVALTTEQLKTLNTTEIPADVWRLMMLSPSIIELPVEPSDAENPEAACSETKLASEDAVVPARRFAFGEGFNLNAFINFGAVSRLFNALVRESREAQNRMRAFASVLPRFMPLQRSYLASSRVAGFIAGGQLTLNQAVADIAQDRLPTSSPRIDAVGLGVSPMDVRVDWLSHTHINALKVGIPFEEIVRLTEYQVYAMLVTFLEAHKEAIKAGIPFEEIKGLTYYQVQAILITRDKDNIIALTRKDVISVELGAVHIEALKKEIPFEQVKISSELQLKKHLAELSKGMLQEAPVIPRPEFARPALTRADVISKKIGSAHIDVLNKGGSFRDIIMLSELQLRARSVGFSDNDILQSWLSDEHVSVVQGKSATVEEVSGLSWNKLKVLRQGYKRKEIESLNDIQLHILSRGFDIEKVKTPTALKWFEEVKNFCNLTYTIDQLLDNKGCALEQILELNAKQLELIARHHWPLEQVKHPIFLQLLEENKSNNSFMSIIISVLRNGHVLEKIAGLNIIQLELVGSYNCSLEQVKSPILLKLLEANKNNTAFKYVIATALGKGHTVKDIAELNEIQLSLLGNYDCTLEQVKSSTLLKLLEDNKSNNNFAHVLGKMLQKYTLEDIAELNAKQLQLIQNYHCSLEQVKNPTVLRLLEENKGDDNFIYVVGSMLQRYKLEDMAGLNATQLSLVSSGSCTLDQVKNTIFLQLLEKNKSDSNFVSIIVSVLKKGHALEDVAELNANQLRFVANYNCSVAQVKNAVFLDLLEKNKSDNNFVAVIESILKKGHTLEAIAELNANQLRFVANYNCSVAQVKNAVFLDLLEKNKSDNNFVAVIESILKKGHTLEAIAELNAKQLRFVANHNCSLAQVKNPIFLELLEKNKSDVNFEHTLGTMLQKGYLLEDIVPLNTTQLSLIVNYNCTLETVTSPILVALYEKNKNNGYFVHAVGSVLQQGHTLDQIENLSATQLQGLCRGRTIEQVTNPELLALSEKFGNQFSWVIAKLLKDGIKAEDIFNLTILQLRGLDVGEDMEMTLEKVRHPNFSESALSAMLKGHSFETVIDLQPWQHHLLVAGVSLEKVEACRHKPYFTLAHVQAVQAGANFDDIESLNYAALQHYLATPCSALPQMQQPLPSRVESKDDRFAPVVVHTSNASTSSSASSAYYPSGGGSSSSSSASSSYNPGNSSSSGSTLTQYQQHQQRTEQTARPSLSVEAAEGCYSSDEENKRPSARRLLPSPTVTPSRPS